MQQPMPHPEDIIDPTTVMNMTLVLMAKAFKLNYSTPTNNNQRISSNPRNRQIAQPGMNLGQDRHMQMDRVQNVENQVVHNAFQNSGVQNVGNHNRLIVVLGIANPNANQNGNGNVVAARAEGNDSVADCSKERSRNPTPGIQLQAKEFDLMAAVGDLDEIEEVNAKCILMANLQQASTSGTQTDNALVYDSDGSAEINALHLSSANTITTLNEEIANVNNMFSKENSTVSSLLEEKKKVKSDFKKHEDGLLDKQIQLENKIMELDNILVKMGQSIQKIHILSPKPVLFYHTEQKMALRYQNPFYLKQAQQKKQSLYNGKVLIEKHDPPAVYDSEETLQLAQESRLKIKQLNKEIKPTNYANINQLSGVFVSQKAKSRKELYFSNISKMAIVSKSISLPNEEFSDDTSPSVAWKFLNEFKSLAKEIDESLAKHTALEFEIERLLRAVVSQDIMSIVQSSSVVDTSNPPTEFDPYNDMQQKFERLQAQLGDLKGTSKDTPCESDTLDPLSQKLDNENVSEQKDITKGTSVNTKFANQSTERKPSLKSLRNNFVVRQPNAFQSERTKFSKTRVPSKVVDSNDLINSSKTSREDKFVPINKVRAGVRINPTTVSRPHVITKKHVNSDSNGLSSMGVDNTAKTRRPQRRSNTKNDRAPSASKSSCIKNKEVEVEEHHRKLLLSKNKKHMSSEYNNIKLAIRNDKSKVVCAMLNQRVNLTALKVIQIYFMVRRLELFQAYDWESKASHQFNLEVFGNLKLLIISN
ncbi:hypothetical protein Tco_1253785 [Tanacetum coccineum]